MGHKLTLGFVPEDVMVTVFTQFWQKIRRKCLLLEREKLTAREVEEKC